MKVTMIPYAKRRIQPILAYAEFVENNLLPLPEMPVIVKGRLKAFPRGSNTQQAVLDQPAIASS